MRALICYESIFGNTRQIAEAIGDGLRGVCDVEVVEVGQADRTANDVDLLVVGGPTHTWSMSRDATRRGAREQAAQAHKVPVSTGLGVREWLEALQPAAHGRMAAAFDTAMRPNAWFPHGSAARAAAQRLEHRNYGLLAEPEQFFVAAVDGPLEAGELERARAWGIRLAARARDGAMVAPRHRPRPGQRVVTIVGSLFGLFATLLHDVWRPWTGGAVTAEWAAVIAAVSVGCFCNAVGNALLLATRSPLLLRVVACVVAATNLVSAVIVRRVYPFDFSAVGMSGADLVLRPILLLVVIGSAIALIVQAVRLILQLVRRGPSPPPRSSSMAAAPPIRRGSHGSVH